MLKVRRRRGHGITTSGTALVLFLTEQGFLFAADGLEQHSCGKTLSTSTQKIFQLNDSLAFSSSGLRRVWDDKTEKTKFDLPATVQAAFGASSESFPDDFEKLTADMAERIRVKLAELGDYPKFEHTPCFAEVFLAGYFHGEPRRALICFIQKELTHCEAHIQNEKIPLGFFEHRGSPPIWNALKLNNDPKLHAHRCAACDKMMSLSGPNLEEAKSIAKAYIQACSDPAVQEGHPECNSIGGNMHMASVTAAHGFEWILKPL